MDGIENLFAEGMVGIGGVGRIESEEAVTLKKGFV